MSTECTHGGQCYLAENVPVFCSLCANAFINVTGNGLYKELSAYNSSAEKRTFYMSHLESS